MFCCTNEKFQVCFLFINKKKQKVKSKRKRLKKVNNKRKKRKNVKNVRTQKGYHKHK